MQAWTVTGHLAGSFVLDGQVTRNVNVPPIVEGLTWLRIEPEFGPENEYTGRHRIHATIQFEADPERGVQAEVVADRSRLFLDAVASLVCLATGRRVRAVGAFVAEHQDEDDPSVVRRLTGRFQHWEEEPPATLDLTVLAAPVDDRSRRAIRWWARGLASEDVVDAVVSFANGVDHLSGRFDRTSPNWNACAACQRVRGGKKFLYLLETTGLSHDQAAELYRGRNMVAHGLTDLSPDELHRLSDHAHDFSHALHTAIAHALGIQVPPMPGHLPINPDSAFLELGLRVDPDEWAKRSG